MIYAKQIDKDSYTLVNENGDHVWKDGELAYHPHYFVGKAEESGYPVFKGEVKK